MAINPLLTTATQPAQITESVTALLRQLSGSVQLSASLKLSSGSSLLSILQPSLNTPQTNNTLSNPSSLQANLVKPILVQLPKIDILQLRNANIDLPVVLTILDKSPKLRLQIALLKQLSSTEKSALTHNKLSTTEGNFSKSLARSVTPIIEIIINPNNQAKIKSLLTGQLSQQQLNFLNSIAKQSNETKSSATIEHNAKQITSSLTSATAEINVLKSTSANIATGTIISKVFWPQHAALEKLSQTLLISKLVQLNQQIPTKITDPLIKVFQTWVRQLLSSVSEQKTFNQFISAAKSSNDQWLRSSLKQQAPLWEATLKNELRNSSEQSPLIANNTKAQLFKIIQSLPVILSRLNPAIAAKFISSETEIWQLVFKIKQLINQQSLTAIPTTNTLNQPELIINFLEQNLRLLVLWLRNIEQQQSEQHARQSSSNQQQQGSQSSQQSNNFRFELPLPTSAGSDTVKVEIEQQAKKKSSSKNKWKWKLKLHFEFSDDKKIITNTRINEKEISIQFNGTEHYDKLITVDSMTQLSGSLEEKTGLSCSIMFQRLENFNPPDSLHSFNAKA